MVDATPDRTQHEKTEDPVDRALLGAYRQVLLCVFIATLFLIFIIVVTLLATIFIFEKDPKILLFVALSGALGAFFSALMRLYNFKDLPKALIGHGLGLRSGYLIIYSLVPPIVGAIGATAIYIAFASGLIEGDLFPKFKCYPTDASCDGFSGFVKNFGPDSTSGYAKALIWGFLAGFSERLVPDLLQKVTTEKSS